MTNADKQQFAYRQLIRLKGVGLGWIEVSKTGKRRNLVLDLQHPHIGRLTSDPRPKGFVRVEESSILIRQPFKHLIEALPAHIRQLQDVSDRALKKGFRVTMGPLTEQDIITIFDTILTVAGHDPAGAPHAS
jgi:hypothetical protein